MKKVGCLVIFLLFLISLTCAQEINLTYPDKVEVGVEFYITVSLKNFDDGFYDLKIEVLNGTSNIAERFWDGSWKSTYYWITNAINTSESKEKTFKLRIAKNFIGIADMKVKVRSSSLSQEYDDYTIEIINKSSEENNSENKSENKTDTNKEALIFLEMKWEEDEIINGKEFDIDLKAFNLKDTNYDVKVWIEKKDDETIISERYDEKEEKWESGTYYINNFFDGPGNKSNTLTLRIKESYKDFLGEARIYYRTRDGKEINKLIEIIEKEEEAPKENDSSENKKQETVKTNSTKKTTLPTKENESSTEKITSGVIRLGSFKKNESESIKINKGIVYESKNEIIKKYSLISFSVLCLLITLLVIIKKL